MAYGEKEDRPWYEDLWEGAKNIGGKILGGGEQPSSPGAMGYQSGPGMTMDGRPYEETAGLPGRRDDPNNPMMPPQGGAKGVGGRILGWAKDNPEIALSVLREGAGLFSEDPYERSARVGEERLDLRRDQFGEEKRLNRLEEDRAAEADRRIQEAKKRERERRMGLRAPPSEWGY